MWTSDLWAFLLKDFVRVLNPILISEGSGSVIL